MTLHDLPLLNACLNTATALLLLAGWIQIKRGNKELTKNHGDGVLCLECVSCVLSDS